MSGIKRLKRTLRASILFFSACGSVLGLSAVWARSVPLAEAGSAAWVLAVWAAILL